MFSMQTYLRSEKEMIFKKIYTPVLQQLIIPGTSEVHEDLVVVSQSNEGNQMR